MTPAEAQQVVTLLIAAFPRQLTELDHDQQLDTMRVYRKMLADLDFERAEAAVLRLLATARFMPTIAEIRAAVGVVAHGTKRSGAEAWGDVHAAMRKYGSHRTPGVEFNFDDPIVVRLVRAFGWYDLCKSENPIADRARFIDAYEKMESTERTEAAVLPGAVTPQLPMIAELAKKLTRGDQ